MSKRFSIVGGKVKIQDDSSSSNDSTYIDPSASEISNNKNRDRIIIKSNSSTLDMPFDDILNAPNGDLDSVTDWLVSSFFSGNTESMDYLGEYNTYNDLINDSPAGEAGRFAYILGSQGTKFLPGSLGGTYYGAGWYYDTGSVWTNKNDVIFEGLEVLSHNNVVIVKSLSDLPTPSAGVITLLGDTIYEISGSVDIGANRLSFGSNTTVRGKSPALDIITSTTTGSLITSSESLRLWEVGFSASNGTIFELNGSGTEVCLCVGVRFFGSGGLGSVSNYDLFEVSVGLFAGFTSGLSFSGACKYLILNDVTFFENSGVVNSVDLSTATFDSVKINGCDFTVGNGGTGINVLTDSGNININGAGIIAGTSFQLIGTGVSIVNYNPLDQRWNIDLSNEGIDASDRLIPTGWGVYSDGETSPATQVFTSTPSKVQIDGLGAISNSDFLPKSIRGISELWDSANDTITPIMAGDSYDLRFDFSITGESGNPARITVQLDIGGAPTLTLPVVTNDISLTRTAPFTLSVGFPIFCLSTFFNNGGQIFISTDQGTVTVSSRTIFLSRNSSGAS